MPLLDSYTNASCSAAEAGLFEPLCTTEAVQTRPRPPHGLGMSPRPASELVGIRFANEVTLTERA